jgi:hypothetical protein
MMAALYHMNVSMYQILEVSIQWKPQMFENSVFFCILLLFNSEYRNNLDFILYLCETLSGSTRIKIYGRAY